MEVQLKRYFALNSAGKHMKIIGKQQKQRIIQN
jgi:hypothetical protein